MRETPYHPRLLEIEEKASLAQPRGCKYKSRGATADTRLARANHINRNGATAWNHKLSLGDLRPSARHLSLFLTPQPRTPLPEVLLLIQLYIHLAPWHPPRSLGRAYYIIPAEHIEQYEQNPRVTRAATRDSSPIALSVFPLPVYTLYILYFNLLYTRLCLCPSNI